MKYPAKSLRRFAPTTAVAALASATALSAILYAGTGVTAIPESADAQIVRPANGFADLVEAVLQLHAAPRALPANLPRVCGQPDCGGAAPCLWR